MTAANPLAVDFASEPRRDVDAGAPDPIEFPVREYIGAMASELAQMARWDGDAAMGQMLDAVAHRAQTEGRPG